MNHKEIGDPSYFTVYPPTRHQFVIAPQRAYESPPCRLHAALPRDNKPRRLSLRHGDSVINFNLVAVKVCTSRQAMESGHARPGRHHGRRQHCLSLSQPRATAPSPNAINRQQTLYYITQVTLSPHRPAFEAAPVACHRLPAHAIKRRARR